jgi:hypothetical protein
MVSRRHHAHALHAPHVSAPSALAAAAGPLWATWIHTGTVCPGHAGYYAAGPRAEVSPLAFKFFVYFSEYIQILESS